MLLGNGITVPFQLLVYPNWPAEPGGSEGIKTLTLVGCYLLSAETVTFVGWLIENKRAQSSFH